MPNSIEIFENTLLKLLVRRGSDSDRLSIVLDNGELGFTTDTERLYVGDGSTPGGILVGNVYKGTATNVTTLAPACAGDLAYDSDNNNLYRLKLNDGSNISDWELIGGVYTAANSTITINSNNQISVGILSAGSIDSTMVSFPIYLDTGKISLSSVIPVDSIIPKNNTNVQLFSALNINGNVYKFPTAGYTPNSYLTDVNGNGILQWLPITLSSSPALLVTANMTVTNGLTASVNGVDVTGTSFNPLTGNVQIGTSTRILSSATLYATYDGVSANILASKGILSATKVSTGKYRFFYLDVGTDYPSANANIIDLNNKQYIARVTYAGRTECGVETYISNAVAFNRDAVISLQIIS